MAVDESAGNDTASVPAKIATRIGVLIVVTLPLTPWSTQARVADVSAPLREQSGNHHVRDEPGVAGERPAAAVDEQFIQLG